MKKTILILAMLILSYGCSNGVNEYDLRDDLSYLNFQNERLKGIWYIDKVIKPDGSIENYVHSCATHKDHFDFQHYLIQEYYYLDNCISSGTTISSSNFMISGYVLSNVNGNKLDGTYTLSGNTLRVDYDEVEIFFLPQNNMDSAKGLIFSRE